MVALVLAVTWIADTAARGAASPRSRRGRSARRFFVDRVARRGADRPAPALRATARSPQDGAVGDHRHRAVLDHRVSADVLPDGVPNQRDGLRARADRDGVRDAGQQPVDRLARQPHRSLSRVPDRRHRARRRGLLVMAAAAAMPLWVPMVVDGRGRHRHRAFMNLIVAVVQSARPAAETGTVTATINLVRQVGSTVATAIIGGIIGVAVAACCPPASTRRRSPRIVHGGVRGRPAGGRRHLRRRVRADLLALALVYVVGGRRGRPASARPSLRRNRTRRRRASAELASHPPDSKETP